MKKTIIAIALLFLLLPAMAGAQSQVTDYLYSYESEFLGVSGYAGAFKPDSAGTGSYADTMDFIQYIGVKGIDVAAVDMAIQVMIDTSLGTATDTTTFTLYAYPIFDASFSSAMLRNFSSYTLWQYPVSLTDLQTGRSSVSFAASHDSTYIFRSDTWWGGLDPWAIVYRLTVTATDSFYVEKFNPFRRSGY